MSALSVIAPPVPAVTVRRARIADMAGAAPLINGFARDGLMLPKTGDQLARLFREFVVAIDEEGRMIGCGALRVYSPTLGEITSLAIDVASHGLGVGRLLVEQLVQEAYDLQLETVFALTLRPGFFQRLGFHEVEKVVFPHKVWADCRNCPKLHACDEIAMSMDLNLAIRMEPHAY